MKAQILTDFSGWRDTDLDRDALIIAGAMNNNPHFPMLADKAAALANAADAFHSAMLTAARGNGEAHRNKENKKAALLKALRYLGLSINIEADGDLTKLESTGYPLAKKGHAGSRAKAAIKLTAGTGMVAISIRKVDGAGTYMVRYTEAPVTDQSEWISF